MLKEATYKDKFETLKAWMPSILESIKRDIKNDHLKNDWQFCKAYLQGKNYNKATIDELSDAYLKAIKESDNGEALGEFLANRWMLKHTDIYHFFEQQLSKINPDFAAIETIDDENGRTIISAAIKEYGARNSYIFTIVNSVVFGPKQLQEFAEKAKKETETAAQHAEEAAAQGSIDSMKKNYELQISRLEDKYEKKLAGLQKKYLQDVESLKKQISTLQKKLAAQ